MKLSEFKGRKFNFRRAMWYIVQDYLFRFTPYNLNSVRCSLLRLFGARIGRGVVIRPSVRVDSPWNLKIGDYSWIGGSVILSSLDKIFIGRNSCISQNVFVSSGTHDYRKESFDLITSPVKIGNGVWVGAGSMIHPGVRIGDNSIVGAMSNVLKDIRVGSINYGNPCKLVRMR